MNNRYFWGEAGSSDGKAHIIVKNEQLNHEVYKFTSICGKSASSNGCVSGDDEMRNEAGVDICTICFTSQRNL